MCPTCGQSAPLVLRPEGSFCTACGAARAPLSAKMVNFAGRPARVTGTVARWIGWVVLVLGLLSALLIGALFQSLMPAGVFGFVLGGVIALFSALVGALLLTGGGKLTRSGSATERATKVEAIRALAQHRGGIVTARDVASSLLLSEPAADALLTELATVGEGVSVEVSEQGELYYRLGSVGVLPARPRVASVPGMRAPSLQNAEQANELEALSELARQERLAR